MRETTAEVQRDIEETRRRVSQTLAELGGEVTGRRDALKAKAKGARDSIAAAGSQVQSTVTEFAREHPWYAIGAAVALGMLVGRSGADAAVVRGAASGAGSAARGTADAATGAARAAASKVKGLVGRGGDADGVASGAGVHAFAHDPAVGAIGSSAEDTGQADQTRGEGLFYRLQTGIVEAVGGSDLLAEMRREAGRISGDGRSWPVAEQPLK